MVESSPPPPSQSSSLAPVHGLALTIRNSTESETFDLGGLPAATIEAVVQDAFQQPLPLLVEGNMIRITLVVGAGKQARQKYDAQALKMVTTSLQSLGFSEDRGASCIVECAGMYKLQHDTGKNLKTVVVFPKVGGGKNKNQSAADGSNTHDEDVVEEGALLTQGSLESKVAISTLNVFTNMVQSKCPTWSQKKALLQLLDDSILAQMKECDELLMTGQLLSASQQSFYESCRELTDKREYLQSQSQAHVDRGDLTKPELEYLQHQNEQRLQELKAAQAGGGSNKKTKAMIAKVQERHDKLHEITPKEPAQLQHHAALGKLWKQLAPLQHLDEHSNRLLSVSDTQLLGKKMELLEQIHDLELASRGWLEDDDIFESRLKASRKQFQSQFGIGSGGGAGGSKRAAIGGSGSGGGKASGGASSAISAKTKVRVPISKWVTPTETKQSAQAKKKARLQKGDVFGAMMAADDDDSSSDDDDGEDDDGGDEEEEEQGPGDKKEQGHAKNEGPVAISNEAKSGGKAKKKNKKKKGSSGGVKTIEDEAITERPSQEVSNKNKTKATKASSSSSKAENKADSNSTVVLATLHSMLFDYLVPFFLAAIAWLVGLLFGKPKSKNKKAKQH